MLLCVAFSRNLIWLKSFEFGKSFEMNARPTIALYSASHNLQFVFPFSFSVLLPVCATLQLLFMTPSIMWLPVVQLILPDPTRACHLRFMHCLAPIEFPLCPLDAFSWCSSTSAKERHQLDTFSASTRHDLRLFALGRLNENAGFRQDCPQFGNDDDAPVRWQAWFATRVSFLEFAIFNLAPVILLAKPP